MTSLPNEDHISSKVGSKPTLYEFMTGCLDSSRAWPSPGIFCFYDTQGDFGQPFITLLLPVCSLPLTLPQCFYFLLSLSFSIFNYQWLWACSSFGLLHKLCYLLFSFIFRGESDIRFNLMAVVSDRLSSYEQKLNTLRTNRQIIRQAIQRVRNTTCHL